MNLTEITKILLKNNINYKLKDFNNLMPIDYINDNSEIQNIYNKFINKKLEKYEKKNIRSKVLNTNNKKKKLKIQNSVDSSKTKKINQNKLMKDKEKIKLNETLKNLNKNLNNLIEKEKNLINKNNKLIEKKNNLIKMKCKNNENLCKHCKFIFNKKFNKLNNQILIINNSIHNFYKFIQKNKENNSLIYSNLINNIKNTIKEFNDYYEIIIYGSHENGLDLPDSDIDIVIDVGLNFNRENQIFILREIKNLFITKNKFVQKIFFIESTSFPIIKITSTNEFLNKKVDISIKEESHNGIMCVKIIKDFMNENKILKPIILYLKNILFKNFLNDPYKGGLSSYGLILMIVSYFQFNENKKKNKKLKLKNLGQGKIFLRLLDYYGNIFNNNEYAICPQITFNPLINIYVKKNNNYLNEILTIMDPLNYNNNITRSCFNYEKIKVIF